jgi:hypothetical protein
MPDSPRLGGLAANENLNVHRIREQECEGTRLEECDSGAPGAIVLSEK